MTNFSKEMLDQALFLLGEVVLRRGHPPQHFVVCGGSSLIALELVDRTTTRDVDVLARLEGDKLQQPKPLPDWLREAAEDVRSELGLPADWFNTGPADDSFFQFGFPEGIEERLTTQRYGEALCISFISRYDQIFFKLYAAADQGGRHFVDLQQLKPTGEELRDAACWTRGHDPSDGFRMVLADTLKQLGHGKLADEI